jgi:hypothetical protein
MQYKQLKAAINPELLFMEVKVNLWKFVRESSILMTVMIRKTVLKMFLNEDSKYEIKLYNDII